MAPFPAFPIPDKIRSIVREKPGAPDFMDLMLKLGNKRARANTKSYHLSLSTKLFLEEEYSLFKKFDRFNTNNIQIEHVINDKFRFKVHVSIEFEFSLSLNCLFFF